MKRTINSTGRKRIPHDRIAIRLTQPKPGDVTSFSFQLGSLETLGLNPEAKVFVEAYVASSMMRFPFGTVALVEAPDETSLTEIDSGGRPLFRVKIVEASADGGKILAAANEISPGEPGDESGRRPLLPLRQTELGEDLWMVQIGKDSGPELLVNNRIPGLSDRLVTDPMLQGLVLPAALKRIFEHLFELDEDSEWGEDWKMFASSLEQEPIDWDLERQESSEEIETIVNRLTQVFSARNAYASRTIEMLESKRDE